MMQNTDNQRLPKDSEEKEGHPLILNTLMEITTIRELSE